MGKKGQRVSESRQGVQRLEHQFTSRTNSIRQNDEYDTNCQSHDTAMDLAMVLLQESNLFIPKGLSTNSCSKSFVVCQCTERNSVDWNIQYGLWKCDTIDWKCSVEFSTGTDTEDKREDGDGCKEMNGIEEIEYYFWESDS